MKNKLTTKQILDYTEAQQTEEKLRKDENKSSNTHDDVHSDVYESKNDVYALTHSISDKSIDFPIFKRKDHKAIYVTFLDKLCKNDLNLTQFAVEYGIHRSTVHYWLKHKCTAILIDKYIQDMVIKDKLQVYSVIRNKIDSNAAYGRLYLERYENWTANSKYNMPVQINFNFQGVVPDGDQVDADVIDVDEEAP